MTEHDDLIRLDTQVKRIISDIDSEKDTRKRRNTSIDERLEKVNRRLDKHEIWFALAIGGGAVLLFVLKLVFKI